MEGCIKEREEGNLIMGGDLNIRIGRMEIEGEGMELCGMGKR